MTTTVIWKNLWFDGKSAKDKDKLRFIEVKVRFTLKMYNLIPAYDDNNSIPLIYSQPFWVFQSIIILHHFKFLKVKPNLRN